MKTLFLIFLLIPAFGFSQYYVTEETLPTDLNRPTIVLLKTIDVQLKRTEQQMTDFKFEMDNTFDSVYNETIIDTYINQLNNIRNAVYNQFLITDTIQVNYDGENWYLPNDLTGIIEHRTELARKYNRLVDKWGKKLVDESPQGKALREEYMRFQKYYLELQKQ